MKIKKRFTNSMLIIVAMASMTLTVPAKAKSPALAEGSMRAVFTSFDKKKKLAINRCGVLTIDYKNGHSYSFGLCDKKRITIAKDAKVQTTTDVVVTDKKITILSAVYEILDIKKDTMIGSWTLGKFHNSTLVFKRLPSK